MLRPLYIYLRFMCAKLFYVSLYRGSAFCLKDRQNESLVQRAIYSCRWYCKSRRTKAGEQGDSRLCYDTRQYR